MLRWIRKRPDAVRPPSGEPLEKLQKEEYWQRSRQSLEKYLNRRSRDYRARAFARGVKDFAKRNASHFRETVRRTAIASLILLIPIGVDAWIESAGLGASLRSALRVGLGAIGILPVAEAMRSTGSLGSAAVQIAGVSLPLFYTVVSASLVSSYARAPESVRTFALNRSFVTFFEVPAWVLGLWGVAMVAASEMGLQPGITTRVFVAGLAVFVLAAVPLAFWRVVESASPGALVYEMVDDISSTLADAKEELKERADPEMLRMLRGLATQQARAYVELASFVDEAPVRSQSAARQVSLGAAVVLDSAAELQGRLPESSEWHSDKVVHNSPFRTGGMPGPAAGVRLPMESSRTKNPTWLESAMGEAMKHALTAALKDGDEGSIGLQLQICYRAVQAAAANGHLEGALAIQSELRAILDDSAGLDTRAATIAEDAIGNLSNAMIDGVGTVAPRFDELARVIHDLDSPLQALPQGVGEGVRRLAPKIRLELVAENRIEGKLYTPISSTTARLAAQAAEDRTAAAQKIMTALSEFLVERARQRPSKSRGPGIPPILHTYHALSRLQRKIGALEAPLHQLDRPTYVLKDPKVKMLALNLRRRAVTKAIVILGDVEDLGHDPDQTDLVGTLYYLTSLEMVTALSEAGWPNAPKEIQAFLEQGLRIFALRLATMRGASIGEMEAAVAPFREAWRVAGYGLLWAAVHNSDQEIATRNAVKGFVERAAARTSMDPKELMISWTKLLDLGAFSNFPYVDSRFGQDNDMWDALVRGGLAQPLTQMGYDATPAARSKKNRLLSAVSRDPGDVLHEMDAMAMAIVAEELDVDPGKLSRPVEDAQREIKRRWGKYGPPWIPGVGRRTDDDADETIEEDRESGPEDEA